MKKEVAQTQEQSMTGQITTSNERNRWIHRKFGIPYPEFPFGSSRNKKARDPTIKEKFKEHVLRYAGEKNVIANPLAATFRFKLAKGQRRSDLDGLVEPFLNALTGHLFFNDVQVVELHAYRERVPNGPKIEICLEALEDTEKVKEVLEELLQKLEKQGIRGSEALDLIQKAANSRKYAS